MVGIRNGAKEKTEVVKLEIDAKTYPKCKLNSLPKQSNNGRNDVLSPSSVNHTPWPKYTNIHTLPSHRDFNIHRIRISIFDSV